MHFDDAELLIMSLATQEMMNNPEWLEEVAVEYDTGEDFLATLRRKCRRTVDSHV